MFERTMTDTELETVMAKASALSAFFREIGPKYDQENKIDTETPATSVGDQRRSATAVSTM